MRDEGFENAALGNVCRCGQMLAGCGVHSFAGLLFLIAEFE